jgi:hypothetical protein
MTICELAPWEVRELRESGTKPDCKQHRHISKRDACEKTCHGDFSIYAQPIAEWVGPRAILLKSDRVWRRVPSAGVGVMQLVEGTAPAARGPLPYPEQFTPHGLPTIRNRRDRRPRARRHLVFTVPTAS